MPIEAPIERSAVFSEDGMHRYRLERKLGNGNPLKVAGIMVNPSKAGATVDDHTVRKWYGFADRLGYGTVIIGNKFSWCATDINELKKHAAYASGVENDKHLEQIMRDADFHIVAWGPLAKLPEVLRPRWKEVVRIADRVGCPLYCLGPTAQDGHPRHPLMLAYDTPVQRWEVPWFANRSAAP